MNKVHFSSEDNTYETPQDFFDKLNSKYNFTLDPCCTSETAKCDKFFTIEDDGLKQSWENEIVFCNPPYGRELPKWVEKCYDEAKDNNALVVMLIPARTDTKYFHKFIYKKRNVSVEFLKGRLKFGNEKNSAPFPSMVVKFHFEVIEVGDKVRWIDSFMKGEIGVVRDIVKKEYEETPVYWVWNDDVQDILPVERECIIKCR